MSQLKHLIQGLLGAVIFYTIIPLPRNIKFTLSRIARFSPFVGWLLALILALLDGGAAYLHVGIFLRSAVVVALWLGLTGGLHLDGAMDSADGLGVRERSQRLQVMQDSHSGAFAVMVAVVILLLKTLALSEITQGRWFVLLCAAGWGRWSQVSAIAFYPYLKPTGKGALHRQTFVFPQDLLLGWLGLGVVSLSYSYFFPLQGWLMLLGGTAIALGLSYYFYRRFGGHTGDTYGAVVEWTEVFSLCLAGVIF